MRVSDLLLISKLMTVLHICCSYEDLLPNSKNSKSIHFIPWHLNTSIFLDHDGKKQWVTSESRWRNKRAVRKDDAFRMLKKINKYLVESKSHGLQFNRANFLVLLLNCCQIIEKILVYTKNEILTSDRCLKEASKIDLFYATSNTTYQAMLGCYFCVNLEISNLYILF